MKIPSPMRPQKSSTSVPGARTEEWLSPTRQPALRHAEVIHDRKEMMLAYRRGLHIIQSAMRIHAIDLAIVVVYLLGVTGLGVWFRRGQRGGLEGDCQDVSRDYFLGDGRRRGGRWRFLSWRRKRRR